MSVEVSKIGRPTEFRLSMIQTLDQYVKPLLTSANFAGIVVLCDN